MYLKTLTLILFITIAIGDLRSKEFTKKPTLKIKSSNDSIPTIKDAITLIENKNESEGIRILDLLISNSTDSLSYLYFLKAIAFYKLQNFQSSMISIEKSISYNSLNFRSYACKGDIFQKTNLFDSALFYYEKASIGLPDDQYLLNNLGTLYTKQEKFELAKNIYHKIETIEPSNVTCLYNMAYVYYKLSQYDIALRKINKAIDLKNDDYGLYNLKGQILYKQGNKESAIKSFETSIKLNPKENNAIENLKRIKTSNK